MLNELFKNKSGLMGKSSSITTALILFYLVSMSISSNNQNFSYTYNYVSQDQNLTENKPENTSNQESNNFISKILSQKKKDWDHKLIRENLYSLHNGELGIVKYNYYLKNDQSTPGEFLAQSSNEKRPVFQTSSLNTNLKAKLVMDNIQINFGLREGDYDKMDMSQINDWNETPVVSFTGRFTISKGSKIFDFSLGSDINDKSKSSNIIPKGNIKLAPRWNWPHEDEFITQQLETNSNNFDFFPSGIDEIIISNSEEYSNTNYLKCHCESGRVYNVGRLKKYSGPILEEEAEHTCKNGKVDNIPGTDTQNTKGFKKMVKCGNVDKSEKVSEEFSNLRPYLQFGRLECKIIPGNDTPKLVMNFTPVGYDINTENYDLEMSFENNCLIKNYNNDGTSNEEPDNRTLCMHHFDNMYLGCVKGAMPEVLRDREIQFWHDEKTSENQKHFHEYAQKVESNDMEFDRWHPFFGYRKDGTDYISLLLFNPIYRQTRDNQYKIFNDKFNNKSSDEKTDNIVDFMKNSKQIDRETNKRSVFMSCSCASGGQYDIINNDLTECPSSGENMCENGGLFKCINYYTSTQTNSLHLYDSISHPLSKVKCNKNTQYNYNKLEIENLFINYGFGVIRNIFCINQNGNNDKECKRKDTLGFGDHNMLAILLTDSIESMDVNNRIHLVSDLRYPTLGVKNNQLKDKNWSGKFGGLCVCPNFEIYAVGGHNKQDNSACVNGEFRKYETLSDKEKKEITEEERNMKGVICRDINYKLSEECMFNLGTNECGKDLNGKITYCKHERPYCLNIEESENKEEGKCIRNKPHNDESLIKYGAIDMPTTCIAIHETLKTEVAEFTQALDNKYKKHFQKKFIKNQENRHKRALIKHNNDIKSYNYQIEIYKRSVNEMRNAKSIKEYEQAYKKWDNVKKYFEKEGCGPSVPPPPPKTLEKPKIEDECHKAYKLGWKIGKDIAQLVTESGETYGDLQKQMKCVKEYIAIENTKKDDKSKIKQMCLDKGRKEASRLIWGLSRNPVKLKQYLQSAKLFEHSKMAYKIGYKEYLKDQMNLEGANHDIVDLTGGHKGLKFKGNNIKNSKSEYNDFNKEVDFYQNEYRYCHCVNGESYQVSAIINNGIEKGCSESFVSLTDRDKSYCLNGNLENRCINRDSLQDVDLKMINHRGIGQKCGTTYKEKI